MENNHQQTEQVKNLLQSNHTESVIENAALNSFINLMNNPNLIQNENALSSKDSNQLDQCEQPNDNSKSIDVDMRSLDHTANGDKFDNKINQQSTDLSNQFDSEHNSISEIKKESTESSEEDKDLITCSQLADCLQNRNDSSVYYILIDTRSFIEYNNCHIQEASNVCCSKIIKRRLQNNKTTVREMLNNVNNGTNLDNASSIVVYDQGSLNVSSLPDDSCLKVLWNKLVATFNNVRLLKGKAQMHQKKPSMDAISQPCLPNIGPTRILPFLYLGSQVDAMNQDVLKNHNITYELNVSTTCPKPDFIKDSNFLRIPVNDNYSDKLLPYFPQAINFLDKVRESSGCVLVHCLGGISRSATVAIAYIMQYMKMTSDDAYRYLKGKRATISPNFNFLGQLLEYEKQLIDSSILPAKTQSSESNLLRLSRERQENGENDFYLQPLTPSQLSTSSPKHHVLHHHFNPHLMCLSNQEKKTNSDLNNSSDQLVNQSADGTSHNLNNSATNLMNSPMINSSTSQFTNLNSNLNANGAQKRTCSFSSSPNTRKMTLKLSSVNENDNLGSIVFM